MSADEILQLLIAERDRLNLAIAALQGQSAPGGRPPKRSAATTAPKASRRKRGRRKFTKAQREEQAERMRQYWAKRKRG